MKTMTIRRVSPRLAKALEHEKRRRGASLNTIVLDVLEEGLGVKDRGRRRNGLARLAGTWSQGEFERFETAVAVTEVVDPELWR